MLTWLRQSSTRVGNGRTRLRFRGMFIFCQNWRHFFQFWVLRRRQIFVPCLFWHLLFLRGWLGSFYQRIRLPNIILYILGWRQHKCVCRIFLFRYIILRMMFFLLLPMWDIKRILFLPLLDGGCSTFVLVVLVIRGTSSRCWGSVFTLTKTFTGAGEFSFETCRLSGDILVAFWNGCSNS